MNFPSLSPKPPSPRFKQAIQMTLKVLKAVEGCFQGFCARKGIEHSGPCCWACWPSKIGSVLTSLFCNRESILFSWGLRGLRIWRFGQSFKLGSGLALRNFQQFCQWCFAADMIDPLFLLEQARSPLFSFLVLCSAFSALRDLLGLMTSSGYCVGMLQPNAQKALGSLLLGWFRPSSS